MAGEAIEREIDGGMVCLVAVFVYYSSGLSSLIFQVNVEIEY